MKCLSRLGVILLFLGAAACSSMSKAKPLVPLSLEPDVKPQAIAQTEQGTQAYQAKQFDEAKSYFSQAVATAPQSGPAHYNYALALYAWATRSRRVNSLWKRRTSLRETK